MSYKEEQMRIYEEKISILEKSMPDFMRSYISSSLTALKPSSLYMYARDLNVFLDYMMTHAESFSEASDKRDLTLDQLGSIKYQEMDSYAIWVKSGRADKTFARMMASVSALYAHFIRLNKLQYNPVTAIRKPKNKAHNINRLRGDEEAKLLKGIMFGHNQTDTERKKKIHERNWLRDYCIIRIFLFTGIRVSELVGLDIEDVDVTSCSLAITRKGGKSENVYFDDETKAYLIDYMTERRDTFRVDDDERALFVSRLGSRMSVRSVQQLVEKYKKTILPNHKHLSPHKLRASFATDFYEASGGDLLLTSKRMGHVNVQTTTIYAEATKQRERESRNILGKIADLDDAESIDTE